MSKRYGRNQKRAHRERIAYLERSHAHMRQFVEERDEEIAEVSNHLQYVAAVLGHLSVLNPSLHHVDGHDRMVLDAPKPDDIVGAGLSPNEVAMMEIMRTLEIGTVRDAMRRNIHAVVHMADKTCAYAMSESTLRTLTTKQLAYMIEKQIAPCLSALLAAELKGVYR
jgi:hypothetical protein